MRQAIVDKDGVNETDNGFSSDRPTTVVCYRLFYVSSLRMERMRQIIAVVPTVPRRSCATAVLLSNYRHLWHNPDSFSGSHLGLMCPSPPLPCLCRNSAYQFLFFVSFCVNVQWLATRSFVTIGKILRRKALQVASL